MRITKKDGVITYHYRGSLVDNINKSEDELNKIDEELVVLRHDFKVIEKIYKDAKDKIKRKEQRREHVASFMRLCLKDYFKENKEGDN